MNSSNFNTLDFNLFLKNVLQSDIEIIIDDYKKLCYFCYDNNIKAKNIVFDINLAAYLLDVNSSDYSIPALALSYGVKSPVCEFSDSESRD